jgi:hypothetical protein
MDPVYVENSIQAYLQQNNFKFVNEQGENYYKTSGVIRGFKYWYNGVLLHIEAWYGKIGKEIDISDGKIMGAAYKIPYYNSVLSLMGSLEKDRQMQQYTNAQSYEQVNTQLNGVYNQPNGVYNQPNGTYNQPNGTYNQPNGAYNQPNGVYNQPNSAILQEINKSNDKNAVNYRPFPQ